MALIKRDDNLSLKSCSSSSSSKRKQIVLEEDEFIDALDKIIERDFFPVLSKMKQQLKSFGGPLDGVHIAGDLTGLISQTPTTFDTPTIGISYEADRSKEMTMETNEPLKKIKTNLSLNAFLAKYTSEDNASFDEIMKEAEKRHRDKYPWLYVKGNDKSLTIGENQSMIEGDNPQNQLTVHYKSLNSLMFVPDGLKIEDQINSTKHTTICHENTRFKSNPFNEQLNGAVLAEAAAANCKERSGKIGIDGKEMVDDVSRVGGYSYLSLTPSPAPGVTNTPLMTWGMIEGTPYSLESSESPYIGSSNTPGTPHFKIPDVPERERIGHALAEKINKKNRDKKKEAFKQAQYLKNSPLIYSGGKTFTESLGSMSPAAQRLATTKLGINRHADKELRGTYSPAITRTPEGQLRSPLTPSPSSYCKPSTPKPPKSSSLTDGLLDIPRKSR
ncbi:splicing factor ESS-2 homolog [Panonychus citri]|uniref:splicing factor ESS-2 homolog n=1 Tax=Panonychus citri TaxID=50023 RepID=UPI0023078A19|nr:splicing factor ESS-2 homolog [Panonychus citri]